MKIGIYCIKNKINGKIYIGSSKNLIKRWKTHQTQLKKNKHHCIYLQRAWNKYGSDAFEFQIIEYTKIQQLFNREQYWIDKLKPQYNIGSVGGGDNISKHPNLDKIRQKHSINAKLRYKKLSNKDKQILSNNKRGNKNPNWKGGVATTKLKCDNCGKQITYSHKKCTLCSKIGQNNPFYGKNHSDETKQKLRQKMIGKKPTNTQQIKIDNTIYKSQTDAAKVLGVSNGLITYRLKHYSNYIRL